VERVTTKKRILITGVSHFLGLRLAKRLEDDPNVEHLVGVDQTEPAIPIKNLEFVKADISSPLIARVLSATAVDTLIHTNISSRPGRLGGRPQMKENNVMGTLRLLAAAQRSDAITKVVMKSSTAVYGSSPDEPSILTEKHAAGPVELQGYGKDCAEAETYARDFGRRRQDVELTILRTQNVVGPTARTSLSQYLSLPIVPTALGFDPRLQLLHEEDAVEALYGATFEECPGIFNVAGDGIVYLSQAIRMLGRVQVPLLLPAAQGAAGILRSLGVIDFPIDQLKLILYGRVVDSTRAKAAFGFAPKFSTTAALRDFAQKEDEGVPEGRPSWERELYEFIGGDAAESEKVR
jgi:UDP-glucose 4-epimerase